MAATNLNRWQRELDAGNIWRAKEILRGHIAQAYNQEEYFTYGIILYECHDLYEAGRYLFAAGTLNDPKYSDAIDIFLKRNKDQYLPYVLPKSFRYLKFEEIPASVQNYFISMCGEDIKSRYEKNRVAQESGSFHEATWKGRLENLYAMTVAVLFIIVFVVGIITSVKWIGSFMTSDEEKCLRECGRWNDVKQECLYPKSVLYERLNPAIQKIKK